MAMNSLVRLHDGLLSGSEEVFVDRKLGEQAMVPLQRMLDFSRNAQLEIKGSA
jgi:quinolinate synthase